MANVVAKVRGYFGGLIREAGEQFPIPDDIMNDPKRRPKWVRPHAFGGKGDHDGDGKTGGSKPAEKTVETSKPVEPNAKASAELDKKAMPIAEPVVVPADWETLSAAKRKALAKSITGENVPNATEADSIIAAYVASSETEREPFADAPAPQTITDMSVVQAIGGVQPDWIAPGTGDSSDI